MHDVTNAQTVVTADIVTSARNDVEDDSTEIPSDARDEAKSYNRQYSTMGNDDGKTEARALSHVYEEIRTIKEPYSSLHRDHHEKYSPSSTSKALIDTLLPSRQEIYEECARMKYSPVYTDRLIYTKESLLAVEVVLCQRDDVSCFAYREGPLDEDCMLIYSYTKTNAAGIFYSHCWPRDVFDLTTLLKPNIRVLNHPSRDIIVNTQLYHRYVNNHYARISKVGCASMTFYRDSSTMINCTRRDSYDNSEDKEYQRNRSSLLLLEPLLLSMENSRYKKNTKNRTLRTERVKIVKILIAYAVSFLILTSITFYIVYFT